MAKKDKKAKSVKPGKLPKSIGGVKIPKAVRRRGEKALALARTPLGKELIATGLVAAGAALAAAQNPDRAKKAAATAADGAAELGKDAAGKAKRSTAEIADHTAEFVGAVSAIANAAFGKWMGAGGKPTKH